MSRKASASEYKQRLTDVQEETLIGQINYLTNRGLPPTSSIIRSLAEEMIQDSVGKNWTRDFVKRHKERLTSLYLRNIDSQRVKAEYLPIFEYFYSLVTLLLFKYRPITNIFT
jgi:hypothetical protein